MVMVSAPLDPFAAMTSVAASPTLPPIARARLRVIRAASVPLRSLIDDRVGAAGRVEDDLLDVVEVHGHRGDVAEEADAAGVVRNGDVLDRAVAVEEHAVRAGLALERVEVVARVPDELVVAGAHQGEIVAVAAEDEVVARRPLERVGADPAEQLDLTCPAAMPLALITSLPPRPLRTSRSVAS